MASYRIAVIPRDGIEQLRESDAIFLGAVGSAEMRDRSNFLSVQ